MQAAIFENRISLLKSVDEQDSMCRFRIKMPHKPGVWFIKPANLAHVSIAPSGPELDVRLKF